MGIVEKLSQLITSKSNLRNKINEKISDTSKQIPENTKLEDFPSYVDNIEGGGPFPPDYEINNGNYLCAYKTNSDVILVNFLLSKCKLKKPEPEYSYITSYSFDYYGMFTGSEITYDIDIPYIISIYDNKESSIKTTLPLGQIEYFNGSSMFNNSYMFTSKPLVLNISKDIMIKGDKMFNESRIRELKSIDDEIWVVNGYRMFYYCNYLNTIPIINLDCSYQLQEMFYNCSELTEIHLKGRIARDANGEKYLNGIRESTTISLDWMFRNCSSLKKIIGLDVTDVPKGTYSNLMFYNCSNLNYIDWSNSEDIKIDIDLRYTGFDRDSLMVMLESMPVSTSNPTISLSSSVSSTLSDEDIAAFSAKNYTIS